MWESRLGVKMCLFLRIRILLDFGKGALIFQTPPNMSSKKVCCWVNLRQKLCNSCLEGVFPGDGNCNYRVCTMFWKPLVLHIWNTNIWMPPLTPHPHPRILVETDSWRNFFFHISRKVYKQLMNLELCWYSSTLLADLCLGTKRENMTKRFDFRETQITLSNGLSVPILGIGKSFFTVNQNDFFGVYISNYMPYLICDAIKWGGSQKCLCLFFY